jgi:hypothetical protein
MPGYVASKIRDHTARKNGLTLDNLGAAKSNPKIMPYLPITSIPQDESDFPRAPVELTVKAERLTGRVKEIFAGVTLHEQRSKTDKPMWVTFCDGREILFVSDKQGRGTYIYRSFSGTDGKSQGFWYPVGGILAAEGKSLWIIKSGLTKPGQHGMGRSQLTAFIEYINQVLPHADDNVDAFLVAIGGQANPGWSPREDVETKPIMNVLLPLVPPQSEEADAWRRWAVQTWKEIGLNRVWGRRDMT